MFFQEVLQQIKKILCTKKNLIKVAIKIIFFKTQPKIHLCSGVSRHKCA